MTERRRVLSHSEVLGLALGYMASWLDQMLPAMVEMSLPAIASAAAVRKILLSRGLATAEEFDAAEAEMWATFSVEGVVGLPGQMVKATVGKFRDGLLALLQDAEVQPGGKPNG